MVHALCFSRRNLELGITYRLYGALLEVGSESVSQPFLLVSTWAFSHSPNLVPQFLSQGIVPCVALHLVHLWKEGNSRASLVAILA